MSLCGFGTLRGTFWHLRWLTWEVSAVHEGWGDMTTCRQNFDELCRSMENFEYSGKR